MWMRKPVNRSSAMIALVIIAACALVVALYPLALIRDRIRVAADGPLAPASATVDDTRTVTQYFFAYRDHLRAVEAEIAGMDAGRYLTMEVITEQGEVLFRQYVDTGREGFAGTVTMPAGVALTPGMIYGIRLSGCRSTLRVAYEAVLDAHESVGIVMEDDTPVLAYRIRCSFLYDPPLPFHIVAGVSVAALALACCVGLLLKRYYAAHPEKDALMTRGQALRSILLPLLAAVFLVLFIWNFPLGRFDDRWTDLTFYGVGIVIAFVLAAEALIAWTSDRGRTSLSPVTGGAGQEARRPDGEAPGRIFAVPEALPLPRRLRRGTVVALVALSIRFACDYMNGLYDIFHHVAERRELLCVLLLLFLMLPAGARTQKKNLAIAAVAAALAAMRLYRHLPAGEEETDALLRTILWTEAACLIVGAVVAAQLLLLIVRRLRKQQKPAGRPTLFALCTIVFFVCLFALQNGRYAAGGMVIAAAAFYALYRDWEERPDWTRLLTYGIALHFAASIVYSMTHRVYAAFSNARFGFLFHTVTVTAEYLTSIACVMCAWMLCALYAGRRKTRTNTLYRRLFARYDAVRTPFLLFGAAAAYAVFTASRTAFLSIGLSCLLLLLLLAFREKRSVRRLARGAAALLASAVLLFAPVFTLQRILPAIVARPVVMETEQTEVTLRGAAAWDHRSYISLEKLRNLLMEKVLGMEPFPYDYPEDRNNYHPDGTPRYDVNGTPVAAVTPLPDGTREVADGMYAEVLPAVEAAPHGFLPATPLSLTAHAAEEEQTEEAPTEEQAARLDEVSNGRLTIFRAYLARMNLTGHPTMGVPAEDGTMIVHAHNTYLQVMYDHGLIVGALFVLWLLMAAVAGICACRRKGTFDAVPLALVLGFAVAGISEWVFQASNPMTLMLLYGMAPLLYNSYNSAPYQR